MPMLAAFTMLSRDGHPTQLGEAIAHYASTRASLHVLRTADNPGYRKTMKGQGNLQEGRHSLGRVIFHGKRGELRQRCYEGMEDQLGALGLVLNAIVLFNTCHLGVSRNLTPALSRTIGRGRFLGVARRCRARRCSRRAGSGRRRCPQRSWL